MKKFTIRYFSIAAVICILLVSVLSFSAPVSASTEYFPSVSVIDNGYYYDVDYNYSSGASYVGELSLYLSMDAESSSQITSFPSGTYVVYGDISGITYNGVPPMQVFVLDVNQFSQTGEFFNYDFGEEFVIPSDGVWAVAVQSFTVPIVEREEEGLFYSAWELLAESIYGADAELTPEMTLTLTILCTLCALAVIFAPFFLVYWILRFIFRW